MLGSRINFIKFVVDVMIKIKELWMKNLFPEKNQLSQ